MFRKRLDAKDEKSSNYKKRKLLLSFQTLGSKYFLSSIWSVGVSSFSNTAFWDHERNIVVKCEGDGLVW